jgi:hypothetical protein
MPPFVGPRASLYWQRKPVKVWVVPSSMRTGMETCRKRCGSRRYWCMAGSSFMALAALSSWDWAMRKGLRSSVAGVCPLALVVPLAWPAGWRTSALRVVFGRGFERTALAMGDTRCARMPGFALEGSGFGDGVYYPGIG